MGGCAVCQRGKEGGRSRPQDLRFGNDVDDDLGFPVVVLRRRRCCCSYFVAHIEIGSHPLSNGDDDAEHLLVSCVRRRCGWRFQQEGDGPAEPAAIFIFNCLSFLDLTQFGSWERRGVAVHWPYGFTVGENGRCSLQACMCNNWTSAVHG